MAKKKKKCPLADETRRLGSRIRLPHPQALYRSGYARAQKRRALIVVSAL